MLASLYLLTFLTTLLPLAVAQDYNGGKPIDVHVKLLPPNLSPDQNMITRNLDWHKALAVAFVNWNLNLNTWTSFDAVFHDPLPQLYPITTYKFGEGNYKSPSDCHNVCQAFMGQAIGAGVQQFQCDHRPPGQAHCWMGYAPKIAADRKRDLDGEGNSTEEVEFGPDGHLMQKRELPVRGGL